MLDLVKVPNLGRSQILFQQGVGQIKSWIREKSVVIYFFFQSVVNNIALYNQREKGCTPQDPLSGFSGTFDHLIFSS